MDAQPDRSSLPPPEAPGPRRFAFSPAHGFVALTGPATRETAWYTEFLTSKADIFLLEHELQHLNEHAALDLLIAIRNSLRVGGRLRISETDWHHPLRAYRDRAARSQPRQRFTLPSLLRLLARVGFAADPVEFRDETGALHLAEPRFEAFGAVRRSCRLDPRFADPALRFSSLIVDAIKVSDAREPSGYAQKIHAVGDSHVRFLGGKDETSEPGSRAGVRTYEGFCAGFVAYHLGPALTFSLDRYGTKTRALEQIEALFDRSVIPPGAEVMFSFGEIDCRFHVCREAERSGVSVESVVAVLCGKYAAFLDKVKARGYRPAVWAPFATTQRTRWGDPDHPVYGEYEIRDHAMRLFNARMQEVCGVRGYRFLSLYEAVKDESGHANRRWFCDALHLSQRARGFLHAWMPAG